MERSHWLCEMCLDEGVTRPATKVDHIKPLALGGSDDDGNTRNLCDPHHDGVTRQQFGQRERISFGVDGLPTDPSDPWHTAQ